MRRRAQLGLFTLREEQWRRWDSFFFFFFPLLISLFRARLVSRRTLSAASALKDAAKASQGEGWGVARGVLAFTDVFKARYGAETYQSRSSCLLCLHLGWAGLRCKGRK